MDKAETNLPVVLNQAGRHDGYLEMEVRLHTFLTSAIVRSKNSSSQPGHFITTERTLGTH
jgi:hypothetical protein